VATTHASVFLILFEGMEDGLLPLLTMILILEGGDGWPPLLP